MAGGRSEEGGGGWAMEMAAVGWVAEKEEGVGFPNHEEEGCLNRKKGARGGVFIHFRTLGTRSDGSRHEEE